MDSECICWMDLGNVCDPCVCSGLCYEVCCWDWVDDEGLMIQMDL